MLFGTLFGRLWESLGELLGALGPFGGAQGRGAPPLWEAFCEDLALNSGIHTAEEEYIHYEPW